jgi:hypothetical protein
MAVCGLCACKRGGIRHHRGVSSLARQVRDPVPNIAVVAQPILQGLDARGHGGSGAGRDQSDPLRSLLRQSGMHRSENDKDHLKRGSCSSPAD